MTILDLFAGPGGWSHSLNVLGARDVGLEWDEWACKTRAAAGQLTIRTDVALYPVWPFLGKTAGLIASPPARHGPWPASASAWWTSRSCTRQWRTSLLDATPARSC